MRLVQLNGDFYLLVSAKLFILKLKIWHKKHITIQIFITFERFMISGYLFFIFSCLSPINLLGWFLKKDIFLDFFGNF